MDPRTHSLHSRAVNGPHNRQVHWMQPGRVRVTWRSALCLKQSVDSCSWGLETRLARRKTPRPGRRCSCISRQQDRPSGFQTRRVYLRRTGSATGSAAVTDVAQNVSNTGHSVIASFGRSLCNQACRVSLAWMPSMFDMNQHFLPLLMPSPLTVPQEFIVLKTQLSWLFVPLHPSLSILVQSRAFIHLDQLRDRRTLNFP